MGKKEMNARLKQRTMKQQLNRLFPNKVTIQIPLNEELLSDWKLPQLDLDFEILKSQSNNFLNRVGVDIIKDQALTNVEKIIGLAWNHHFKHCTDPSFKDTELSLPISTESIRYGLNIFLGIQNEIKCLKKSLEDISLSSGNDDVSQGFKISLLPSSSGVPNNYVDGTEMKDSPDHSLPSPSALNENLNLDTVDPEVGKKRDTGHELRPGSGSISKTLDHPRDFRELLKNFDDPILNSARKQAVIHVFQQCLLDPSNIEVSFENFPYYLSETTKNVLIASTYIPLKCNKFAKYTSDLLSVCPRILLSGPVDSDLYKEMLTKALAKHFAAKLLIVDSLLLPGGSMVKEVGLIKENSLSERAAVLAKCAEHPATMYCKNSVSGVEAEIPGGSPITSKTYTFKKGDRVKYRGGLSPGQTPLR